MLERATRPPCLLPVTSSALEPHGLNRSASSTSSREADSRLMKHHDLVLIRGPAGCNNAGWGGPSVNEMASCSRGS